MGFAQEITEYSGIPSLAVEIALPKFLNLCPKSWNELRYMV
jgi:hypothetical protein